MNDVCIFLKRKKKQISRDINQAIISFCHVYIQVSQLSIVASVYALVKSYLTLLITHPTIMYIFIVLSEQITFFESLTTQECWTIQLIKFI